MNADSSNYGLFTIPAYYVLCFVPHLYARSLLRVTKDVLKKNPDAKVKPGKLLYNMPNPRGHDNAAKYASILDQSTFQRWERCRAAHNNLLESAPFVISAILAGLLTKQPAQYMNTLSAAYLATRVLYLAAYIRVERGAMAFERTFWFMVGNGILTAIWIRAGKQIMNGDY